jgi:prepilin-type N-terminal cleavage/methylation domain-containing protein
MLVMLHPSVFQIYFLPMHTPRHGFSLVELSIVLVIIGLLVGGVLAGRSLIRASEIRSVITDIDRYNTAQLAFRDKYFALPGDITNATAFWGAAPDCTAQTASGQATCNGDGDGNIMHGSTTNNRPEMFLFWQHLNNAGLIEGAYDGVRGPGTYGASSVAGVNSPATRVGKGCVSVIRAQNFSPYVMNPAPTSKNGFILGSIFSTSNPDYCYGSLLRPEEAWSIDTKADDGIATSGHVYAWVRPNCTTDTTPGSGIYNLSNKTVLCALVFNVK